MNKKQKPGLLLFCFLSIGLMVGIGKYMERAACAKMIRGYVADYVYCDRSLSVSDFEQFDYDSTYEEMIERLGMPNGLLYISMSLPYYELWGEDGNGKYMCVLIASPWEKGWGINVYSRETKYYFVTIDILNNNVASVQVALLERKLCL